MQRLILCLIASLVAGPAAAWQAGTENGLCTLRHSEPGTEVLLTYDPNGPLYSITITDTAPWPDSPIFGIAFLGGRELTITTDRHVLSDDGRALTVSDTGFGNVLDGLSRNTVATAFTEGRTVSVSLAGAAAEVEVFRNCGTLPAV